MPRKQYNLYPLYRQTLLGECGHIVEAWPKISRAGGRGYEYICDTCTAERWALSGDDELPYIWVHRGNVLEPEIPDMTWNPDNEPRPTKKPRKTARKPAKKTAAPKTRVVRSDGFW